MLKSNTKYDKYMSSTDILSIVPIVEYDKVEFSIAGDEDILQETNIPINRATTFENGLPDLGGICSPSLGTISKEYNCSTCDQSYKDCPGHNGQMRFKYPMISPVFIKQYISLLKQICLNCSQLKSSSNQCNYCHANINNRVDVSSYVSAVITDKDTGHQYTLYNHEIRDILRRITPETAYKLKFSPLSHPSKLINDYMIVPPINIRAEVRSEQGKQNNDQTTQLLYHVVRENNQLEEDYLTKQPEHIQERNQLAKFYYEMIRGSDKAFSIKGIESGSQFEVNKTTENSKNQSIIDKFGGKTGRVRQNLLGKRTCVSARAFIVGAVKMEIDEIIVPLHIAITLHKIETVKPWNIAQLTSYYVNGTKKYPGCTEIIKYEDGKQYSPDILLERGYILKYGDIIHRNLITGDYVLFNRMPTLYLSSICATRIIVNQNPNIHCIFNNPLTNGLFNADYDGDAMNIYALPDITAESEVMQMSSTKRWTISSVTGKLQLNLYEDTIFMSYKLSLDQTKMCKAMALQYFKNTKSIPNFENKSYSDMVSGKEIISQVLPKDINYNKTPAFFNRGLAGFIEYEDQHKHVEVVDGNITRGIVDKSFGQILQKIYHKHSQTETFNTLYDIQELSVECAKEYCSSLGLIDCMISKKSMRELDEEIQELLRKSDEFTSRYLKNQLKIPADRTLEELYESQESNILQSEFVEPLTNELSVKDNNLLELVLSETKGKIINIEEIRVAIGQNKYRGYRFLNEFATNRHLPHCRSSETDPLKRGFIDSSYLEGVSPTEMFQMSQKARENLIDKSLKKVSDAGDQNRIMQINLEHQIINNRRNVAVNNGNTVIQYLYGDDGIDITNEMIYDFESFKLADKEFLDKYFDASIYINEIRQLILQQKEQYIRALIQKDQEILYDFQSTQSRIAIECEELAQDLINKYNPERTKCSSETCENLEKLIFEYIYFLPHLYTNTNRYLNADYVPKYVHVACFNEISNLLMSISSGMIQYMDSSMVKHMFNMIEYKYQISFINYGAPIGMTTTQCISQPITEASLNSIHVSGAASLRKGSLSRLEEIFGAKPHNKCIDPEMIVPLKDDIQQSEIDDIIKYMESVSVKHILSHVSLTYERINDPKVYSIDKEYIDIWRKINTDIDDDNKMLCIRLLFNEKIAIQKNIDTESIIDALNTLEFGKIIVHSYPINDVFFARIYLTRETLQNMKTNVSIIDQIKEIVHKIENLQISGISDIISASYVQLPAYKLMDDGSLNKIEKKYIVTIGINLYKIYMLQHRFKNICYDEITSDNIVEVNEFFGITFARNKIISEIMMFDDELAEMHPKHLMIVADEITQSGILSKINRTSISGRTTNPLHNIANCGVSRILENAAKKGQRADVHGISPKFLVGDIPNVGTTYNEIGLDINRYHELLNSGKKNDEDNL